MGSGLPPDLDSNNRRLLAGKSQSEHAGFQRHVQGTQNKTLLGGTTRSGNIHGRENDRLSKGLVQT